MATARDSDREAKAEQQQETEMNHVTKDANNTPPAPSLPVVTTLQTFN